MLRPCTSPPSPSIEFYLYNNSLFNSFIHFMLGISLLRTAVFRLKTERKKILIVLSVIISLVDKILSTVVCRQNFVDNFLSKGEFVDVTICRQNFVETTSSTEIFSKIFGYVRQREVVFFLLLLYRI